MVLTSALTFSQPMLEKTVWNDKPAVLINEQAIDSINVAYMRLKSSISDNSILKLELESALARMEIIKVSANYYQKENIILNLQNNELKNQMGISENIHQTELIYYKEKAKGKFSSFLLGAGVGGAIVAVLISVVK